MPEILPNHVPSPRTPLVWDGTRYRAVRGHTDGTVQVRGEDQLISYAGALRVATTGVISGAGGYLATASPGAGLIWKVTNIAARDGTTATTQHAYAVFQAATLYWFDEIIQAFGVNAASIYQNELWLDPGDVVRVYFTGGLAGDNIEITMTGHIMTLEV